MELINLKCKRCNHRWIPRKERIPKTCPKCKSPYWSRNKIKCQYRCRAWLYINLFLLEKSTQRITEECDVNKTTIYRWQKKFNLLIS